MYKKSLLFLLILLCLFPYLLPITVKAENTTQYLRVINSETPFYSDTINADELFYLPYTYYVKVIGSTADYYHVECFGDGDSAMLDGFVPIEMLFKDDLPLENPYLSQTITTCESALFYKDKSMTETHQVILKNRNLSYYGVAYSDEGQAIYYVKYRDKLGYVKDTDVFPFVIENHPNELTFIVKDEPELPPQTPTQNTGDFFSLKAIVVILLAFAGIIAIFVAFKPKKQKGQVNYDENEYE